MKMKICLKTQNIPSCTCFLYSATKHMTTFDTVFPGKFQVMISWTPPKFLPIRYTHTVSCKLLCDSATYYLTETVTISQMVSTIFHLALPGSLCMVKFVAVYNPASIDPGIGLLTHTLYSSKFQTVNFEYV